jgi:hypothetical protein
MTEARLRMLGLQATWPLLAELGWLSPGRLDEVLRQCEDPLLSALVRKFGQSFEGTGSVDDAAWFAAWVLTERPNVAEHVSAAQPSRYTPAAGLVYSSSCLVWNTRTARHCRSAQTLRDLRLNSTRRHDDALNCADIPRSSTALLDSRHWGGASGAAPRHCRIGCKRAIR